MREIIMKKILGLFALTLTIATFVPAKAEAVILFEDDFSDWVLTDTWDVVGTGIPVAGVSDLVPLNPGNPYAYLQGWALGRIVGTSTTIDTTGFADLTLSFDARTFDFEGAHSSDTFSVLYRGNGGSWFSQEVAHGGWDHYDINLDSSVWGNSLEIGFLLESEGNGFLPFLDLDWAKFDNVTVSGTNAVPEPASMFLLGSGLLGMAGFRKRKNA